MFKKNVFLIGVCMSVIVFSHCQAQAMSAAEARAVFLDGNQLYKEGKFQEALARYKSIYDQGLLSGHLLYNLGNCYCKMGQYGQALVYYEKARFLIPYDSDLKANLVYTRSLLHNPEQFLSQNLFKRFTHKVFEGLSIDALLLLLVFAYWMAMLVGIIATKRRLPVFLIFIAVFLLLLLVIGMSVVMDKIAFHRHGAIIIERNADVKFEPLASATTYFQLPEGSACLVLEQEGRWRKIKRSDNKTGWLPADSLQVLADE